MDIVEGFVIGALVLGLPVLAYYYGKRIGFDAGRKEGLMEGRLRTLESMVKN